MEDAPDPLQHGGSGPPDELAHQALPHATGCVQDTPSPGGGAALASSGGSEGGDVSRLVRGRAYRARRVAELCRRLKRDFPLEMTEAEVHQAEQQFKQYRRELCELCQEAEHEDELVLQRRMAAEQRREAEEEARRLDTIKKQRARLTTAAHNQAKLQSRHQLRAAQREVAWRRCVDEAFLGKQRSYDERLTSIINRSYFLKSRSPSVGAEGSMSRCTSRPTSLSLLSTQERLERGRDRFEQHWEDAAERTEAMVEGRHSRQQLRLLQLRDTLADTEAKSPLKVDSFASCTQAMQERREEFFDHLSAVQTKYHMWDRRMRAKRESDERQRKETSQYRSALQAHAEAQREMLHSYDPRVTRDTARHAKAQANLKTLAALKNTNGLQSSKFEANYSAAKARREQRDMHRREMMRASQLARLGVIPSATPVA